MEIGNFAIRAVRDSEMFRRHILRVGSILIIAASMQACAPEHYRRRVPIPPAPKQEPAPPVRTQQPVESKPTLEQSRIREENLKEKSSVPPARKKDQSARRVRPPEAPAVVSEEGSLMAKITPQTSPQRAASLRLTEEGRKLIETGEYDKALNRLEKTITIDSTNPYGYYYLAQAHHRLAHHRESLNFLDVAESLFSGQSYWLAELFALRGENYHALGMLQRADTSYTEALRWNPGNRIASEGLTRLHGEMQPSPR